MYLYLYHNPFDQISLFFRVLRKLNFTPAKACRDTFQDLTSWGNFGGQFPKNYVTQQKTNTTAMYTNSILSIEATFVNITFQSSKQEDLNDTLSARLSPPRENRSNSR